MINISGPLHEAYRSFRGPFLACTAIPSISAAVGKFAVLSEMYRAFA